MVGVCSAEYTGYTQYSSSNVDGSVTVSFGAELDISQISVAFSSFHTRMHEALADDGRVDEAERRKIMKDFDAFMRTLCTTMGRV